MAKFVVKKITPLDEVKLGDEIIESDYSHMSKSGNFIQFEYIKDDEEKEETIVKPGIWSIQTQNNQLALIKTSFTNDTILENFVYTQQIEKFIDSFFNRFHVYKKHGIEVPRRAGLFYGAPGGGKTTSLKKVANKYVADSKTAVIMWSTDVHEPDWVKNFVKCFKYEGVEKLIFIMEDLGGTEIKNVDVPSDPSLLAMLDNSEKIFSIPVYIASTTNFPEVFASNLANRPGRFDDKLEIPFPSAEHRLKLLEFFLKDEQDKITEDLKTIIASSKTKEFTPAHIKESIIRAELHDKTIIEAISEIIAEIELFNKGFEKKGRFGFE